MSTATQVSTGVYTIFSDTAAPNTPEGIKNNQTTVYFITGDNTQNSGAAYIQLFGQPSGNIAVGTSQPDMVVYLGGSSQETYDFQIPWTFSNGLTIAVTTTATGSTAPSSPVTITIAYN